MPNKLSFSYISFVKTNKSLLLVIAKAHNASAKIRVASKNFTTSPSEEIYGAERSDFQCTQSDEKCERLHNPLSERKLNSSLKIIITAESAPKNEIRTEVVACCSNRASTWVVRYYKAFISPGLFLHLKFELNVSCFETMLKGICLIDRKDCVI